MLSRPAYSLIFAGAGIVQRITVADQQEYFAYSVNCSTFERDDLGHKVTFSVSSCGMPWEGSVLPEKTGTSMRCFRYCR